MKKVSIIIPCENKSEFIAETIESAIKQTYPNIEIIVVNNASRDNSWDIVNEMAGKHQNITLIHEWRYLGDSGAKNKAISCCNGDYIVPLNPVDTLEPEFVEKAVKVFETKENLGFVYSNARNLKTHRKLKDISESKLLIQNVVQSTVMFKKSDFVRTGWYKTWMNNSFEDWEMLLALKELGLKSYKLKEVLYNKRIIKNNLSKKNKYKQYGELIKAHWSMYAENETVIKSIFEKSKLQKIVLSIIVSIIVFIMLLNLFVYGFLFYCAIVLD